MRPSLIYLVDVVAYLFIINLPFTFYQLTEYQIPLKRLKLLFLSTFKTPSQKNQYFSEQYQMLLVFTPLFMTRK